MSFLEDLTRSITDEIEAELGIFRTHLVELTQRDAPHRTGELRDSIGMDPFERAGDHYRSTIFATAPQAAWTNDGTGIYGPTGQPIRPRNARALIFEWDGQPVAFTHVAGIKAQHWWDDDAGAVMERRVENATDAAFGF